MIAVTVDQLFLSNLGFVVLLKSRDEDRAVPIFIGAAEAQAIAIQINKVEVPRPLTHDLLKNVFDFLECRVKRIEVCDLKEGTFFARLVVERDGHEEQLDCRPSDAIALALRVSAPIFVAETVMAEAGRDIQVGEEEQVVPGGEGEKQPKRDLTPQELLERKLQAAVKDERYEEAARLRDEINSLKNTHTSN